MSSAPPQATSTRRQRTQRDVLRIAATLLVLLSAALAFGRVFTTADWRAQTFVAIGLSVLVAAGSRTLGLSAVAAALLNLVALVAFTLVIYLPGADMPPGFAEWHRFVELLADGLHHVEVDPSPTLVTPGLMILITTGAWFVAHVTHELAMRSRRPGMAIVPATILWAVPLAMPQATGRTWPYAVPFFAAVGLLLLVEADLDVGGFAFDGTRSVLPRGGILVGTLAIGVAAIMPGLLPGYGAPSWWDISAGGSDARGYQPMVDIGDRLSLANPRPVLNVYADRKLYMRIAALDSFDGATWRIGPPGQEVFRPAPDQVFPADEPLPAEAPIATSETIEVTVDVRDLQNIYLPVPYQPVQVIQGGTDMIYSTVGGFVAAMGGLADETDPERAVVGRPAIGVAPDTSYTVTAVIPNPSPDDLRAVRVDPAEVAPYLALPASGSYARFAAQAEQVYAEAGATTAFDQALALQNWFTDPEVFQYSTSDVARLQGPEALETFTFDTRVGYCEYYASAMAVMLRATGIPARVSVGFAPGQLQDPTDPDGSGAENLYEVSTTDAHAWVEVLFPGYGWIRFEPTPRADGNVMPASAETVNPTGTIADITGAVTDQVARVDPQFPTGEQFDVGPTGSTGVSGTKVVSVTALLIAAVGIAGVAGVGVARRARRHRRLQLPSRERVLAAQRELMSGARRHGVGRHEQETARDVTERWIREHRVTPAAARDFATIAQSAAFSNPVAADTAPGHEGTDAEELADLLLAELRRSVSRRDRVVAPIRVPAGIAANVARRTTTSVKRIVRP